MRTLPPNPSTGADMTAAERCERTELLVDQCGCVDHRGGCTPEEEAASDRQPGPWITARYGDGRCTRNGCEISTGDRIRADGAGGWECCHA
jgi:hypothetical protein